MEVHVTTRDKLMRAWQNSMELTRDYEIWSKEIKDHSVAKVFARFAEEESRHAARFREMLCEDQQRGGDVIG
ncbi:MAG: rubrerythrin [Clostridia bacterium]|nr:rubrerythrin [Clostridia bacterium]